MFYFSLQSWLNHEVEVLVSVGQARQTLENLIDDRKVLSRQLAELRSQEQDEDDEPAAKVLSVSASVSMFVCLSTFVICQFDSRILFKNIFSNRRTPPVFPTSFLVKPCH